MQSHFLPAAGLLCGVLAVGGCSKRPAPAPPADTTVVAPAPAQPTTLSVGAVTLGKAIGADRQVTASDSVFGARDTIYATVATTGAPATATLTAVWSFVRGTQTRRVDSTSQTIAPTGPAVTEFHVSKPSGWPAGSYRVEIWADGKSVATRTFTVRK